MSQLGDHRARCHPAKFLVYTYKDKFLSSKTVWDRGSLGPGPNVAGMIISGWALTQLAYFLYLTVAGRSLNSLAMLKKKKKKVLVVSFKESRENVREMHCDTSLGARQQ